MTTLKTQPPLGPFLKLFSQNKNYPVIFEDELGFQIAPHLGLENTYIIPGSPNIT